MKLPLDLIPYEDRYSLLFFPWPEEKEGFGLISACRHCSAVLLFKLFRPEDQSLLPSLLATLSCHSQDGLWSILDFQFRVPPIFSMTGFTLAAGLTRISFSDTRQTLHLCRLAPAADRLKKGSLVTILQELTGLPLQELREVPATVDTIHYQNSPSLTQQILKRLARKKPFLLAQLRLLNEADRILGVVMEGTRPIDVEMATTICDSYEIVS